MASIENIFEELNLKASDKDNRSWIFIVPLILKVQSEGAFFFIKADGEREENVFTIMIEGGPLGGNFLRRETSDLEQGVMEVISEYYEQVWK